MKFGMKAKIAALASILVLPALVGILPATIAGTPSTSGPLIDKEFEVALRKFVSKRFFNRIEASAEQRERLSKIMSDTQEQTRPEREQLRQGLRTLSSLMASEKASDEEIRHSVANLRTLREKIADQRLSAILEARKVLTAEQKQKIHNRLNDMINGGITPKKLGFLQKDRLSQLMDPNSGGTNSLQDFSEN